MKRDQHLHFRWNHALSHHKVWNFAIGERESGKSVDSWFLLWNAFHYHKRPSIVLRRRTADITSAYIEDTANVLNKFLEEPIQLLYMKGDIKQGIVDVKLGKANVAYNWKEIQQMPTFFRVISLSTPMSRIKSLMLKDVKYIFDDEFICNLRAGEKYLTADEYFLIKEIYTTYNREASTPIRIIAAGNPYSVYTPLFMGLNIDTSKLKPGAFIVGPNYIVDCFQVPEELKKQILANNPMYEFDDSYRRYAFSGEAINDQNIRIHKTEPRGFKLKFVFKMGKDFISIHRGKAADFSFWVCKHGSDWLSKVGKRRKIIVFNFGDMIEGSVKFNPEMIVNMAQLKQAMERREITFNCIDAQYMLEDIYSMI